eukprot:TRINITY_DN246_c0_g1_i16.p3 TRINITY_DN246_c0_g1~~TRINITY_DN246_c0_g1_i16.p3  ORF type:complete len:103 (-),score=11.07 TRINITY_DN246_c0_g1_i16:402-710(-)
MIRRPPRSTHCISSAASDVYKRQVSTQSTWGLPRWRNWQTHQIQVLAPKGVGVRVPSWAPSSCFMQFKHVHQTRVTAGFLLGVRSLAITTAKPAAQSRYADQ